MIVMVLLLGPTLFSATAAGKPSGSCKPLGKQIFFAGKKFTCVKKSGKSIWNSGTPVVSVPRPTPTPSPLAEIEPWEKVVQIVRSYRATSVKSETSLDFQRTNKFPETTAANIRAGVVAALNYWSQFHTLKGLLPVSAYTEDDYDWYIDRWIALGRDNTGPGLWERSRGGGAVGWNAAGQRNMWFKKASYTPAEPLLVGTDYSLSYYFHEVTHFFQGSIIDKRMGSGPCWFDEGSAMLIGESNAYESYQRTLQLVSQGRVNKLNELRSFIGKAQVAESDVSNLLQNYPRSSPQCQIEFPQLGYGLGWFVNEKLVYDFGWKRYLQFWHAMSEDNWEIAFQKTFDGNFQSWAEKSFDPYMTKLLNGRS